MRSHEASATALATLPPGWFAVLDGARDANLGFHLDAWNLTPLPLYLEGGTPEAVWNGPILVELSPAAIAHGWLPLPPIDNATFWSWPGDALSLRRHLRSINLVEVPDRAVFDAGEGQHTVVFRHWDANVLAAIDPLLTGAQRARLWGAAAGLVLDAADHGGTLVLRRPPDLPAPSRGLLRFDMMQMAALGDARVALSRQRIAAYLRETAPAHTRNMDDRTLIAQVTGWEAEAKGAGIVTERDLGRWSFLQCLTGGAMPRLIAGHPWPADGRTPSERLDLIFAEIEHRLRRGI